MKKQTRFKSMMLFIGLVSLPGVALAQRDSLVDIFPLEEGNRWLYSWNQIEFNNPNLFRDTGEVAYTVVNGIVSPDSIRWQIFARRDLVYQRDSTVVELIEKLDAGGHHLYSGIWPRANILNLGPFLLFKTYNPVPDQMQPDTLKIYRYRLGDSAAYTSQLFEGWGSGASQYTYAFAPDTGLRSLVSSGMSGTIHWSLGCELLEAYFPATRVAECVVSRKSLFIFGVQGISFDSVVVLSNPGTATLRISEVRVTNDRFTAYVEDSLVAATSAGRLHIRYSPWEFIRDSALIIITSNAPSSPDTVQAIVDTREPTLAAFNTQSIDTLQQTLRGAVSSQPLMITNVGERPLVFDTTTSDNPMFSLVHPPPGDVPVGSSIVDSITFRPVTVGWHRARIIFYSNSMTSPDTVIAKGFGWGALAGFNRRILEFGLVPAGASKDSSFVVTNYGTSDLVEGRFQTTNPAFVVVDSVIDSLTRGGSVKVRVRYDATSSQPQTGIALFSYEPNMMPPDTLYLTGSIVAAVAEQSGMPLEFALAQNYPNPFNPSTTIRFALPHRSHVSLIVYNTLGQQVATLVNGEVEAGYHEVHFNGSGLASGVYLYRLTAGAYTESRKMVLVR